MSLGLSRILPTNTHGTGVHSWKPYPKEALEKFKNKKDPFDSLVEFVKRKQGRPE